MKSGGPREPYSTSSGGPMNESLMNRVVRLPANTPLACVKLM
jgi:hypothetical protein